MSALQEQAVRMIQDLSDENVRFVIEIIQRLMPEQRLDRDERLRAFLRLEESRAEIKQYLPEGFDPDKELEEARANKYGGFN